MAGKAITGIELYNQTELGKALIKVLPPKLTRVIIDIGIDGPVRIYYASLNTGPIVDLDWSGIIERFEVVEPVSLKVGEMPDRPISAVEYAQAQDKVIDRLKAKLKARDDAIEFIEGKMSKWPEMLGYIAEMNRRIEQAL